MPTVNNMKWLFGVMSRKYSMVAESEEVACTAMVVFVGKNIPIAIYEPKEFAVMPIDVMQTPCVNVAAVSAAIKSIKEVSP
jgi:hypothetical protein